MRPAPISTSACSHASTSASVICASAPGPIPAITTSRFTDRSNFSTRYRLTSSSESPSSSFGRPIRTTRTPAFFAASIFSSKPPFLPDSFVTIHSAWNDCSIATFISIENGPCMPMVCAASNPSSAQDAITPGNGSTRAYTRFL